MKRNNNCYVIINNFAFYLSKKIQGLVLLKSPKNHSYYHVLLCVVMLKFLLNKLHKNFKVNNY